MGVQGAREAGEVGGTLSPSAPRHSPNPMAGAGARHGGTTACQHRASNLGCTVRLFVIECTAAHSLQRDMVSLPR